MRIFAIKEIQEIKGRITLYKMIVDGVCLFDEFLTEVEYDGNLISEVRTLITRLYEIAELKLLPQTKFRRLKTKNSNYAEYEIKTHHLRVYLFQESLTGRIIVCGGKKSNQKFDIRRFRKLKKEYLSKKQ